MIELEGNLKFESLKFHLEQQIQNLRNMTRIDLQILTGYMTLQMALGGWLVRPSETMQAAIIVRIGLSLVDLTLSVVAAWLLRNSRLRREEVIATVKNLNQALGYEEVGAYIEGKKINSDTKVRLWCNLYLACIVTAAIGIQVIIFAS